MVPFRESLNRHNPFKTAGYFLVFLLLIYSLAFLTKNSRYDDFKREKILFQPGDDRQKIVFGEGWEKTKIFLDRENFLAKGKISKIKIFLEEVNTFYVELRLRIKNNTENSYSEEIQVNGFQTATHNIPAKTDNWIRIPVFFTLPEQILKQGWNEFSFLHSVDSPGIVFEKIKLLNHRGYSTGFIEAYILLDGAKYDFEIDNLAWPTFTDVAKLTVFYLILFFLLIPFITIISDYHVKITKCCFYSTLRPCMFFGFVSFFSFISPYKLIYTEKTFYTIVALIVFTVPVLKILWEFSHFVLLSMKEFSLKEFFKIYKNEVIRTVLLSIIILAIDLFLRKDFVHDIGFIYVVNFPLIFFLFFTLRSTVDLISKRIPRYLFVFGISAALSAVYSFEYGFYEIYRTFINVDEIAVVMMNKKYWLGNIDLFVDGNNVTFSFFYFALFVVFFIKYIRQYYQKKKVCHSTVQRGNKISMIAMFSLFYLALCHIVGSNSTALILSPESSFLYNYSSYLLSKKKYEITDRKGDFPARMNDNITDFKVKSGINLLFIVNESLRRDHMSLFGYGRKTTPQMDLLFKNAYLFPNAVSNSAVTHLSLESLFTGLNVSNADPSARNSSLLWYYVKKAGLATSFIGSQWLKWLGGGLELEYFFLDYRYIDFYRAPLAPGPDLGRDDAVAVALFKNYLAGLSNADSNFFSVLHFNSTHFSYIDHPDEDIFHPAIATFNPKYLKEMVNKYDNAVHYLDLMMGKVMASLLQYGFDANTIVVFTSDHAEGFYEHQEYFHTSLFYQEGINVPFFIYIPENLKSKFTSEELDNIKENTGRFISNVDIFPTVLDILNIPLAKKVEGQSLFKKLDHRYITSMSTYLRYAIIDNVTLDKFIIENEKKRILVFNLRIDPEEQNPSIFKINKKFHYEDAMKFVKNYQLNN